MKKIWFLVVLFFCLAVVARGEFTFYLVDNFENGKADRWYKFGNVKMEVTKNLTAETRDAVAESCGDYSLNLQGASYNWYVGGIGTDLNIDASPFSRLQLDVYGSQSAGKLKIELYDDDNNNFALEQDPTKDWLPTKDDKWVAEVPVLGQGFTRISIPFTAFHLENPGCGDGIWNPDQKNGSGGLLKIQMTLLANEPTGKAEVKLDNVLFTY